MHHEPHHVKCFDTKCGLKASGLPVFNMRVGDPKNKQIARHL